MPSIDDIADRIDKQATKIVADLGGVLEDLPAEGYNELLTATRQLETIRMLQEISDKLDKLNASPHS